MEPGVSKQTTIEAIFESGVFKPLAVVSLPERQRVSLVIEVPDDLPPELLAQVAAEGDTFAFLADPREDVYSPDDGEPV